MRVEIEEDPMSSKEELDAIVWMVENPVRANTDDMNVTDGSVDGDELGKRGLVKRGRKPELLAWLRKAMADKVVLVGTNRSNRSRGNNAATDTVPSEETPGFAEGSYWEELTPLTDAVEEPQSRFQARAPTVPEEEYKHVPLKYNFDFNIELEAFTGTMKTKVKNSTDGIECRRLHMSSNHTKKEPHAQSSFKT
eukprot:15212713-Ditylum_brightwellii.AAC.1